MSRIMRIERENALRRMATNAVGNWWGVDDMRPDCEDVVSFGEEGDSAVVDVGIKVVMTVWMSAWRDSV